MSKIERSLCSLFFKEQFGEIVQQVGDYILKSGSKPLFLIKYNTKLPISKIKQALCVLIQHNFASFQINEKHRYIEYAIHADRILLVVRYPRYIYCMKTLYGNIAEFIIEEIIENGQLSLEEIIHNVMERVKETSSDDQTTVEPILVQERFSSLVNTHFIQRCPAVVTNAENMNKTVPTLSADEKFRFDIPQIDMDALNRKRSASGEAEGQPSAKKVKLENSDKNSEKIFWMINFDRFHDYFRDELIVKAITRKLGWKTAEVYQALLKLSETKSIGLPSSKIEIFQYMTKNNSQITLKDLEHHLAVLVDDDDSGFVKAGDSGGGMYIVNYTKIIFSLLTTTMHSIVQERFGSQSARIFRLILLKKYLEQKQIEELAMIPAKEAKEMTYKMFQENFLSVQEIPKTPDYAPSRTFYLFHVDLLQLSRMILERNYKAIANAILGRDMIIKEHKRLLEKKQRVDAIIATLKQGGGNEAQLKEVEESITVPEQTLISKVNQKTEKLEQAELQIDETIFILQLAFKYNAFKI